jgi:hypothetical protein
MHRRESPVIPLITLVALRTEIENVKSSLVAWPFDQVLGRSRRSERYGQVLHNFVDNGVEKLKNSVSGSARREDAATRLKRNRQ